MAYTTVIEEFVTAFKNAGYNSSLPVFTGTLSNPPNKNQIVIVEYNGFKEIDYPVDSLMWQLNFFHTDKLTNDRNAGQCCTFLHGKNGWSIGTHTIMLIECRVPFDMPDILIDDNNTLFHKAFNIVLTVK